MGLNRSITWTLLRFGALLSLAALFGTTMFGGTERDARGSDPTESINAQNSEPRELEFAYHPQDEEGSHADSDFEWWYHFGFLRQRGSKEYEYSFVSSFQRSPKGRYLFYNLADLKTGEKHHYALVDRSLFGVGDGPGASGDEKQRAPRGFFASIGRRFRRWALDVLPVLPGGHEFMSAPVETDEPPDREPWLIYGDNQLLKQEDSYEVRFQNRNYQLELTLRYEGPPMPVLGTGLTGLAKPEDQYYYSYPRMSAFGQLETEDRKIELVGDFWYDHQWGITSSKTLMKWCWWGLQLDNGKNVGLFFLQDARSGEVVQQGLTLHHADGTTDVSRSLEFSPKRKWKSPKKRTYIVDWDVEAAELDLTLHIRPFTDNHEIPALLYGRIWEGPCKVEARFGDGPVIGGRGFQELIGQNDE